MKIISRPLRISNGAVLFAQYLILRLSSAILFARYLERRGAPRGAESAQIDIFGDGEYISRCALEIKNFVPSCERCLRSIEEV